MKMSWVYWGLLCLKLAYIRPPMAQWHMLTLQWYTTYIPPTNHFPAAVSDGIIGSHCQLYANFMPTVSHKYYLKSMYIIILKNTPAAMVTLYFNTMTGGDFKVPRFHAHLLALIVNKGRKIQICLL